MKNLLIGICGNSESDTELLVQQLKIAEAAFDMDFEIRTYATGEDFLKSYCPVFDLLFIEFPVSDMDSERLLSKIRRCDSLVQMILISNSNALYHLGYQYGARNYFTKPLWYRNIYHEMQKVLAEQNLLGRPYLWISNQHGDYKLFLHKLRFVETSNRQMKFHNEDQIFYINGKLSDLEIQLASGRFFRCNNSYIVNVDYVEVIEKEFHRYCLKLITGEVVPLNRDRKRELEEMILRGE